MRCFQTRKHPAGWTILTKNHLPRKTSTIPSNFDIALIRPLKYSAKMVIFRMLHDTMVLEIIKNHLIF